MIKIKKLLSILWSYFVALSRLILLEFSLFFSALNIILYNRIEITNIELKGAPFRCDRENTSETMAYLDKLCLENPDLLDIGEEFPNDTDNLPPLDE